MLGAGLCRLCSLCRWRAREGSERGGGKEVEGRGGAARADPVEKTPQEEEEDTQQAARERY